MLQNEKPTYFSSQKRVVYGQVVDRRNALVTVRLENDSNFVVDLNTVRSDFVPIIGDHIYMDCQVQTDDTFVDSVGEILDVHQISPAISKTEKGTITTVNNDTKTGIINRKYFFHFNALDSNYKHPRVDDIVVADIIESDQGKLLYRCLKIASFEKDVGDSLDIDEIEQSILTKNKKGIVVQCNNLSSELTELDETKSVNVFVRNTNDQPIKIKRTFFRSKIKDSQVKLLRPLRDAGCIIEPNEQLEYEFKVTAKYFGCSREMFIFVFEGNIEIGRCFEISVRDKTFKTPSIGTGRNVYKNIQYTKNVWNNRGDVIPGERIRKGPNFVYVKIDTFDVPTALRNMVLSYYTTIEVNEKLDYILPFCRVPLNFKDYAKRFHNLLHLEEIEYFHNIRKYDMERAHFAREQEYLSLTIANIAESRPSLVLGDTVRVQNPWNLNDQRFEGIIHKVLKDRILIKFTKSFHEKYNGEDYKIEFYYSRMTIRKRHHAIDKCVNRFGQEFLFPSQLLLKPVQIECDIKDGELVDCRGNVLGWHNSTLNVVQKEVIKNVLRGEARPMPYVIFGPPGTGKTMTVVETILQLFNRIGHSRILVGTPSNSAANLVTERLAATNCLLTGSFIRLVGINAIERETIPENILQFCATCDVAREGTAKNELLVTESGLKLRCNSNYIARHRIIIGTCNTLGSLMQMQFPNDHFTHVIIDECGQLIEPEALIPMSLLNRETGQIIIAGDPMQLEPIVMSNYAKERDLAVSFLVRILDRFPYQKDSIVRLAFKHFPDKMRRYSFVVVISAI